MAQCPKCKLEDALEYENDETRETFKCEECGARFEADADYDWTGDGYRDCSTPGKELVPK